MFKYFQKIPSIAETELLFKVLIKHPFIYFCGMRKSFVIVVFMGMVVLLVSFTKQQQEEYRLRKLYAKPVAQWPAPTIDEGVQWSELGLLPAAPLNEKTDSLQALIALGKILFFDTRLSGEGKISCGSCHQPELSWTDGKERSIGHAGAVNKRNSPSLQNVWFYQKLFWDGRSNNLEDQAFAPINSESEMHGDIRELPRKLRKISAYNDLFKNAFNEEGIDPDKIAAALAAFQRTISSRKSRFDEFVAGKKKALSDAELRGLHLFRTKARCMNCHNGPLFSDNQFHNNGFHKDNQLSNDAGLYNVTHREEDRGKFKTPSLRDVMYTGPWMHQGMADKISEIISVYNSGVANKYDQQIKPLSLSQKEQADLLAFLKAISAAPLAFKKPVIPE
jgi:cytochrome c peroxidase